MRTWIIFQPGDDPCHIHSVTMRDEDGNLRAESGSISGAADFARSQGAFPVVMNYTRNQIAISFGLLKIRQLIYNHVKESQEPVKEPLQEIYEQVKKMLKVLLVGIPTEQLPEPKKKKKRKPVKRKKKTTKKNRK